MLKKFMVFLLLSSASLFADYKTDIKNLNGIVSQFNDPNSLPSQDKQNSLAQYTIGIILDDLPTGLGGIGGSGPVDDPTGQNPYTYRALLETLVPSTGDYAGHYSELTYATLLQNPTTDAEGQGITLAQAVKTAMRGMIKYYINQGDTNSQMEFVNRYLVLSMLPGTSGALFTKYDLYNLGITDPGILSVIYNWKNPTTSAVFDPKVKSNFVVKPAQVNALEKK